MKGTERYLAFIIERTHITAVEIAHSPRGKTLTAAGSFDSGINFDNPEVFSEVGGQTRERSFSKELQGFMKSINAGSHFLSFGLNSTMAMVQRIPVEQSLTDEEFDIHLQWELAQYHPDANPEHYVMMPYALVNDAGVPGGDAMVISVKKSFVNFLSNVCERMHSSLHIVDIDQFCAESCLTHSIPDIAQKRTVVIGMDEDSLDASLLIKGKNADIRTMTWNGNDYEKIDAYARSQRAEQIYLHGRIVTPSTAERLKAFSAVPVNIADPFSMITLPGTLPGIDEIKDRRQEFTAAVGLAIREE
jgi:Tfp pilus assembly PilM family ATPase